MGDVARYYFDRGIWLFGEHVQSRIDAVSANTHDAALAQTQRQREFQRLMGGDMDVSTGFADPAAGVTDGTAETVLKSGY